MQELENKIIEGISYYENGNIPKAILTLREALKNDIKSEIIEKGHYYLALAYFQNGNIENAADELPKCGSYEPRKVFELIKEIAKYASVDYKKLINELPQKELYINIINEEEKLLKEQEQKLKLELERKKREEQIRLEIEGNYEHLTNEDLIAKVNNNFIPVIIGLLSFFIWGLGLLLSFNFFNAIFRFALQFLFYYIYINSNNIHQWILNNINFSLIFGYGPIVNNLNHYIFPVLQFVYFITLFLISAQSFVFSYFEWYKILLIGHVVEVRNTGDVYINIGFNHNINIGDKFYVYTRGVKPILKGEVTILKYEDEKSLVEFRPNTNLQQMLQLRVGDVVKYKW